MTAGGHRPHTYDIVKWPAAPAAEEWEQRDDPRLGAVLAGVNVLAFLVAEAIGLTSLIGICLALSLFLLMATYIVWERDERRTAIALATGTLPFWLMLVMVL
jgi:hypothetical protein